MEHGPRGPEFRIVGGASEEHKEETKSELERALYDHYAFLPPEERERLEKLEYPKSVKELALIRFANAETNRLRIGAGLEPYDIPSENYHIVPPSLYQELSRREDTSATTFYGQQGFLFNAQEYRTNPVAFGAAAFHETLHLKGHSASELEESEGGPKRTHYRRGISVDSSQKANDRGQFHIHFDGLEEAITAEAEKRSYPKLLELPELADEKKWFTSKKGQARRRTLAEEYGIPEDDVVWVSKRDNTPQTIAYPIPRQVLRYVCEEVQKQFPDQYQDMDVVHKEFLDAHFTGRLLPLARLVDGTFGEGSFRLLGNMTREDDSSVLHLESLRKMRSRRTGTES